LSGIYRALSYIYLVWFSNCAALVPLAVALDAVAPIVAPPLAPTAPAISIPSAVIDESGGAVGEEPVVIFDPPPNSSQGEAKLVVVAPGYNLLPEPKIQTAGPGVLNVSMPEVAVQLSDQQVERASRVLRRRFNVSRERGRDLLYDPDNFNVIYRVRVELIGDGGSLSVLEFASKSALRLNTKVRQMRSRLNVVTLRRLRAGASYRVSYLVEIVLKSPRLVIGRTGSSLAVRISTT
jgi:hypothetical protein